MEWTNKVKKYVNNPIPPTKNVQKKTEKPDSGFHDWSEGRPAAGEKGVIPRICPKPVSELGRKMQREEREYILEKIQKTTPESSTTWGTLNDACLKEGEEMMLKSYGAYKAASLRVIAKADYHNNVFMTPHMFFLAERGQSSENKTPATPIFTHVNKKCILHNVRIKLELCDSIGDGYLTESDLERFVEEMMPHLRTVRNIETFMESHYTSFYKCHAVRKFFFFLDPMRSGRILINTLMKSNVLLEFMKLYVLDRTAPEPGLEGDVPEDLMDNWFTFQIMYRVYQHYVELDANWDGMLSVEEMSSYNNSSFSPMFITRIFELYPTLNYEDEIDFKKYLDFVLATEHTSSEPALRYIWKALDIGDYGFLARAHVFLFAKELSQKLSESNLMAVTPEEITHEIFDMVNPSSPDRINYTDLLNCGQMNIVLSILIDHRAFFNYDNRENILAANSMASRQETEEEESQHGDGSF
eukprot:TRINITY_DN2270_c2_g1_i1.p1 TRINITY_DN2270_c2_g1~~TRINITY_DN2270_c2_g1_i1.p1  ORF type:complete len:470 (+),score=65.38 TRINITY_DN2270_c2_g1_i1:169-1578(+)